MNFDAQDILEVNRALLKLAAAQAEPDPAILVSVATWGRGANPELIKALQPYRVGLGFNGSVVARLPRAEASEILPKEALQALSEYQDSAGLPVCGGVFKDWFVEIWP